MTRLEQIAAAYPLHYQRIVEAANDAGVLQVLQSMPPAVTPGMALRGAFLFASTSEGLDYWNALAMGAD